MWPPECVCYLHARHVGSTHRGGERRLTASQGTVVGTRLGFPELVLRSQRGVPVSAAVPHGHFVVTCCEPGTGRVSHALLSSHGFPARQGSRPRPSRAEEQKWTQVQRRRALPLESAAPGAFGSGPAR